MFRGARRILAGRGLGRISLVKKADDFLYSFSKPEGITLTKVRGKKMYIDMSDLFVSRQLYMTGIWEKEVTDLVKGIVSKGMTFIDLGSHIGYYTILAADLVGKNGRVFAFEPDPNNYALLIRNIEANGYENVTPVNKAVSNKTGAAKLFLNPDNKGDHKLWASHERQQWVNVEATTLDNFFENHASRVDVIKMDIEGGEMAALRGMAKLIERNANLKIISEFWPRAIEETGFSPTEFLNKLMEYDFKLYHISEQGVKPTDILFLMKICEDKEGKGQMGFTNIYYERG